MPELPEVETIRRRLEPSLVGETVREVFLTLPRLLEGAKPKALDELRGLSCRRLERMGKYLILHFGDGAAARALVIHLGMSGQLTWKGAGEEPVDRFRRLQTGLQKPLGPHSVDKHTHMRVVFESGGELLFRGNPSVIPSPHVVHVN